MEGAHRLWATARPPRQGRRGGGRAAWRGVLSQSDGTELRQRLTDYTHTS